MATVNIRNLRKSFGATDILRGVSFDIVDGEFVALVGPSGCGKSTLLRIVAGLEGVTSGDVVIDGVTVNRMAPRERDIAMVFQNYALYPHMTVAENMGFSLTLQKIGKQEIAQQVDRAASILGLEALKDRYPRQLSGGQRQRVAMGRAIVRNPKVFLFDEPLSNLDAKLRVQMRSEIRQLHQRLRTTTIYVTHDQIEALTMADKVVVMNGGNIEQIGAPLDLYDNPASLFVAGFIGSPSMNFLAGQLNSSGGGSLLAHDGLSVPVGSVPADLDGRNVTLGFRPEHVEIADGGLPVEVIVSEPTGSEMHVTGRLAGQQVTLVFKDRLTLSPGQTLGIGINPAALHFFDAASGKRLEGFAAKRQPAEGMAS